MREKRPDTGWRIRVPHPNLEWQEQRFFWSSNGTALTEYALLLGAIACIVAAGINLCDDLGVPVFHHLAGTLAPDREPVVIREIPSDRAEGIANQAEDTQWLGQAHRATARPTSAFLLAAILIAVLWWITRRRRTRTKSGEKESMDERSEDRLQVKRQILWKNILEDPRLLFKNRVEVRHFMTRDVTVVARHTQTDEVRRLMVRKHMHHVLVCNSDGQLQGVVSDRDLKEEPVEAVFRVMTAEPMSVRPDTTASAAIAMMLEHQISCLPVIQGEQICGILTRTDLLLSLQCLLQWWLRFAQALARASDCADKIDAVQETTGRYLFEQRARLESLLQFVADEEASKGGDLEDFEKQAKMFLDTAGELIAMQTFEGDRLSEMAGELLSITRS